MLWSSKRLIIFALPFSLAAAGCGADAGMSGAVGEQVVPLTDGLRSFTCIQTSSGRAENRQQVTGQLDADSAPLNVDVFRGRTLRLEHSSATPTPVPGYLGGYYERSGLFAWSLGSEGTNDYYLLLPIGGVNGSTFVGQLQLFFNHGAYGAWQKILGCTVQ